MGMIPGMMGHEIPVRREVMNINGYLVAGAGQ
jgi:hypothetical protein